MKYVFGKIYKLTKKNTLSGVLFSRGDSCYYEDFFTSASISFNSDVKKIRFISQGELFQSIEEMIQYVREFWSIPDYVKTDEELLEIIRTDDEGYGYEEYKNTIKVHTETFYNFEQFN